jgi:hypothetical protein
MYDMWFIFRNHEFILEIDKWKTITDKSWYVVLNGKKVHSHLIAQNELTALPPISRNELTVPRYSFTAHQGPYHPR